MERVNAITTFHTKYAYSEEARLFDFDLGSLILYSPAADYELHLDFHDHDLNVDHNQDGTLSLRVATYDLNEEAFLEANGYVVEQADFSTFAESDVQLRSFDITARLQLPNTELVEIPDLSLTTIHVHFHFVSTKTVTIKAS